MIDGNTNAEFTAIACAQTTSRPALIYVAGPFTADDVSPKRRRMTRLNRYLAHLRYAASIAETGIPVFSPIVHGFHIDMDCTTPPPYHYWLLLVDRFLPLATEVHVLRLDGWEKSTGLSYEINLANQHGINIKHVTP